MTSAIKRSSPSPHSLHLNGERAGERGGRLFCSVAAPHPNPLPVKNGEREECDPFQHRGPDGVVANVGGGAVTVAPRVNAARRRL